MTVVEYNLIRVLIVMPLAEQRGGAELTLLHLISHGRNLGVSWSVAFLEDGPMVQAVKNMGVSTFVVPTGRLRHPFRIAKAVLQLRQLIRQTNAEIVLSWMGKGQIYGGTAAALAGISAVWFQHGLPSPPCIQDRIATLLPARIILSCSRTTAAAQSQIFPRRPTVTVHPGVDLDLYNPMKLPSSIVCRESLGLPVHGPLIGIVGRLQRWKGMHHLVAAMPAILKRHPDAHAVIVGGEHAMEPDYSRWLRDRIVALGLGDNVILAGLQSNIEYWMQAMDVIVHASDAEPFGMVVIEAMALGKPVAATATAGPTEIISDGVDGLLWPPGDIGALTGALLQLLENSASGAMNSRARSRAAHFDVGKYAQSVIDVVCGAVPDSYNYIMHSSSRS